MWWRSRSTSLESGIANRFPGLVFLNYDTANRGPLGPPGTFWMYAWHVDEVQRFSQPVPAGQKSQIGYRTPRTLEVKLQSASSAS